MSEVKRWAATELVRFEDGLIMERRGTDRFSSNPAAAFIAVVLASDYDTLKAERDRYQAALERIVVKAADLREKPGEALMYIENIARAALQRTP